MTRRGRAAWLAAASLLSACATLPVGNDGLSFEARRSRLEAVTAWELRGRLAIDTGDRGFQGTFNWRQTADTLDLTVRGPLGAGAIRVSGTPRALTVTTRGETHTLTDPEAGLSSLVGWWLPVTSLPAWLLGFPDRNFGAATSPGPDGTLAVIEQRLWRVAYPAYQLAQNTGGANELLLPRRIDLTHGDLKLRLTIDDWRPVANPPSP